MNKLFYYLFFNSPLSNYQDFTFLFQGIYNLFFFLTAPYWGKTENIKKFIKQEAAISSPARPDISYVWEWASDTFYNALPLCEHKSINISKFIPAEGDYKTHKLSVQSLMQSPESEHIRLQ